MRLLVGDETGLLKSISLERNEQKVIADKTESQSRARGIQRMCWAAPLQSDSATKEQVVVARGNGIVECYPSDHRHAGDSESIWQFQVPKHQPQQGGDKTKTKTKTNGSRCVGLEVLSQYASVVHCTCDGDLFIKNTLKENCKPTSFHSYNDLERMRLNPFDEKFIALGGKERDLSVWSLETQQALFKAKNVTHDKLDMRVPVWVKDVQFLKPGNSNGHRVIVGTAYQHVRIYDTNTKRRPVLQTTFGEHPINCLRVSEDERVVYVADTAGNIDALDMRMNFKHLGRFTGPVGSIREMALHPTLPYLAAVGLDRMVHVFNLNTRKYYEQQVVYAKQRLNTVLFEDEGIVEVSVLKEPASKKQRRHTGAQDDDDETARDDDVEAEANGFSDDDSDEEIAYEGLEITSDDEEEGEDEDDEDDEEDDQSEDLDDDED